VLTSSINKEYSEYFRMAMALAKRGRLARRAGGPWPCTHVGDKMVLGWTGTSTGRSAEAASWRSIITEGNSSAQCATLMTPHAMVSDWGKHSLHKAPEAPSNDGARTECQGFGNGNALGVLQETHLYISNASGAAASVRRAPTAHVGN
jgi:hypothetical protein